MLAKLIHTKTEGHCPDCKTLYEPWPPPTDKDAICHKCQTKWKPYQVIAANYADLIKVCQAYLDLSAKVESYEWIKVKDGLPQAGKNVEFTYLSPAISPPEVERRFGFYHDGCWYNKNVSFKLLGHVIAWRHLTPLPEI